MAQGGVGKYEFVHIGGGLFAIGGWLRWGYLNTADLTDRSGD